MTTFLEVWQANGRDLVPLEGERVTLGADPSNNVVVTDDPTVSRMHAVLEQFGAGWCVRDLASTNGTFVNGERVTGDHPIRAGDEVRLGRTRIVLRGAEGLVSRATQVLETAPRLTARERDVLIELCRPLLGPAAFAEPASIRDIAGALFVSEAAVKQHLGRLYDKFDLHDDTGRRRVQLANAALTRGAVTLADLKGPREA